MLPLKKKDSPSNQPAMTATRRLLAGLRDGKMADLELVGDDGIKVPALRCVLACSSPVMHNLLYGEPSRGASSVIKIGGCSSRTLRALVEYCCSDELNASIWDGSCPPAEIVKDIVALARVAHAYGIPNMEERVLEGINPLMGAIPPLACVVFNFADPNTTTSIYQSALGMIRENPYVCLQQEGQNMGGLVCLSPQKVKDIVQDTSLQVDELFLFKQLLHWRAFNRNVFPNSADICKELVTFINLSYIDPSDIKATVVDSGLVEDRKVIDALLEQAISATREGLAFAAMRGTHGKDQIYAMIRDAGTPECNGLYKQIKRDGAALCFGKVIDEKRMMVLLKDSPSTWKICDHNEIYYEWRVEQNGNSGQFPVSGWLASSHTNRRMSTPTIRWYRPRGKSPRLATYSGTSSAPTPIPSSSPNMRHPEKVAATTRIPVTTPDNVTRSSSDEEGIHASPLHHHIRAHRSMDEYGIGTPTSSPLQPRASPPTVERQHQSQSQNQYTYNKGQFHPQYQPQHHLRPVVNEHPQQSPPMANHHIAPRTPSPPHLGFPTMASIREAASWVM